MKSKLYAALFVLMAMSVSGQVGIGTPAPQGALDVNSSTNGILIPRVALTTANTAAPVVNPQGTPLVAGTLVWNTATAGVAPNNVIPGYYYWNGTRWMMLTTNASAWNLNGNAGTVAGTNFIGTTDAVDFRIRTGGTDRWNISNANSGQMQSYGSGTAGLPAYSFQVDPDTGIFRNAANTFGFSTAGTERMRILGNSQVVVNNTGAPNATSVFSSYAAGTFTRAIYGFSGLGNGRGIVGESNTVGSAGMQGLNNNAQGFGVWGYNGNLLGTGIISAGHGEISTYLVDGSGGAFTGYDTAIYGFVTSPGDAQGMLLQDDFGAQWNAGYFDTFTFSYYKILGDGSVSTTVRDTNGNKVVMHCTETPESLFEDYGTAQLVNGRVRIDIDPIFSKNILVDEKHPLKVFVQLEGECNGVYVTNKSAKSFEVVELNGGTSNTPFSYSIVATRGEEVYTSTNGQTRTAKYSGRFTPAPKFKTNAKVTARPNE